MEVNRYWNSPVFVRSLRFPMRPFLSLNYSCEKPKENDKRSLRKLLCFLSFSLFSSLSTTRYYISLYLIHSRFRGIRHFIHSRKQAPNLIRPWHTRNEAKIYFCTQYALLIMQTWPGAHNLRSFKINPYNKLKAHRSNKSKWGILTS